jgi:hypothetical protein
MEDEPERSEARHGLQVAHELTEIVLALPLGWHVTMDPSGQFRILPPESRNLDNETRF